MLKLREAKRNMACRLQLQCYKAMLISLLFVVMITDRISLQHESALQAVHWSLGWSESLAADWDKQDKALKTLAWQYSH
jgi:hypothetical protein